MNKLILASGSQNRITALNLAKIPFKAIAADIDEKAIQSHDKYQRQILVAKGKVEKVAAQQEGFILGADGVNLVDGIVLEKPLNLEEAEDMLHAQSGKRCSFLTGYFAINTQTGQTYQGTSESFYTFRKLSDDEINQYVETEPVLTWAAAFSPANSMAIRFVDHVEGSYSNFNYSMPFDKLIPIFEQEGIL